MQIKKIAIFTGSRADFGILSALIKKINEPPGLKLQIIASGMHCSPEFGLTYKEILEAGYRIDEKVEILLSGDTPSAICKSMGLGLISFPEALERLKPDLLVILGDRFESMAMAQAALVNRIPIAHLHGGESTFSNIDEAIRHSITKMSHLHFVTSEEHKKRVIQLGETPSTVYNVGALGVENALNSPIMTKFDLEETLEFKFQKKNTLVTFHPVTLETTSSQQQFSELLKALDAFPDLGIIFTKSNADTDGRIINKMIDDYSKNRKNAIAHTSLGAKKYLSCLKYVDFVLGNSSSGIIEAPSFKIPTVNIGDRQDGRTQAASTINCSPQADKIISAIQKATSEEFIELCKTVKNPYGDGHTSQKILKIILESSPNELIKKRFYDVDFKLP